MMAPITRRQMDALRALAALSAAEPIAPTYTELGRALGVRAATVHGRITALISAGLVAQPPGRHRVRALSVTGAGRRLLVERGACPHCGAPRSTAAAD